MLQGSHWSIVNQLTFKRNVVIFFGDVNVINLRKNAKREREEKKKETVSKR